MHFVFVLRLLQSVTVFLSVMVCNVSSYFTSWSCSVDVLTTDCQVSSLLEATVNLPLASKAAHGSCAEPMRKFLVPPICTLLHVSRVLIVMEKLTSICETFAVLSCGSETVLLRFVTLDDNSQH